jgi:hypothetical protein
VGTLSDPAVLGAPIARLCTADSTGDSTPDGKPFPVLRVGPVAFFADLDQLAAIRDAIGVYLDSPDDRTPDRAWKGRTDAVTLLAPISGGCEFGEPPIPAPPPFEPSPEDWRDYREAMDRIDRARDYLDDFNAARDDDSETPA